MKLVKSSAALLLATSLTLSLLPAASASPVTSYSNPWISSAKNDEVKSLKPAWTLQTDNSPAVASGNLVVYSVKGKLHAINPATGREQWKASYTAASELTVGENALYFVDPKGQLIGLNAKTGKTLWKAKTGINPENSQASVALANGTLYVGGPETFQAYQPGSGKLLWKQKTDSVFPADVWGIYDGVLVSSAVVSGALTVNTYYGHDPKTGKLLWSLGGSHGRLLDVRKGHLYLRDDFPMIDSQYAARLDQVNIKTGKITSSHEYVTVLDGLSQRAEELLISGDYVYISMKKYPKDSLEGYSSALYRYKLDEDPAKQKPVTYEDRGTFLAGPYMNRFFVQNGLELQAVRFDGKMTRTYTMPENPVSRMDLIGTGAYVGLSDGNFYLVDIATGSTLGSVHVGGRVYGQTLLAGGMVIVQAEGKLVAVKRPAALKP
ncbi:hypothetical protein B9G55_05120 [Saccharibacillus sp. O16]|nr:hypothetical protein B9G55_05120 [Saccharibacillus sp. O16]